MAGEAQGGRAEEAGSPLHRRSPALARAARTWYFLRQNTLAIVGLAILLALSGIALYALTQPMNYTNLDTYCSTNGATTCSPGIPVCTYPEGSAPPGPNCYMTPSTGGIQFYPTVVPPTLNLATGSLGPLPLGSLTLSIQGNTFYSVYHGLLRGSDWSLLLSVTVAGSWAIIGVLSGAVAGTFGGWVDEAVMRLVDIMLSIPSILLVIVVVSVFSIAPGFQTFSARILLLVLAFIVTGWPFYTRIVRGQVLVVREQKYVEAAQASGSSRIRLVFRHIIPNSVYPAMVSFSLDVGTVPLFIGTLVFLGFQIIPPSAGSGLFPEWGVISAISVSHLVSFLTTCQFGGCVIPWWQLLFPGLALFLFAISVNFLSDGLRDALDPRMRR